MDILSPGDKRILDLLVPTLCPAVFWAANITSPRGDKPLERAALNRTQVARSKFLLSHRFSRKTGSHFCARCSRGRRAQPLQGCALSGVEYAGSYARSSVLRCAPAASSAALKVFGLAADFVFAADALFFEGSLPMAGEDVARGAKAAAFSLG